MAALCEASAAGDAGAPLERMTAGADIQDLHECVKLLRATQTRFEDDLAI
jgi:hypothetical protein